MFEAVHNTRSTCFIGFKNTRLRLVFLKPIKHCCSCFKQYFIKRTIIIIIIMMTMMMMTITIKTFHFNAMCVAETHSCRWIHQSQNFSGEGKMGAFWTFHIFNVSYLSCGVVYLELDVALYGFFAKWLGGKKRCCSLTRTFQGCPSPSRPFVTIPCPPPPPNLGLSHQSEWLCKEMDR